MISDFPLNDDSNQEIVSSPSRVVVNCGRGRSGTHQPGRPNSGSGSDRLDTDSIQHPGSRRDCVGAANNASYKPMERRYFTAAATGEFRCHDCANEERPCADAPDITCVYEMNYVLVPDNQPPRDDSIS